MKTSGFWIPDTVWQLEALSNNEKLLLARIINLHKVGSCFASNAYFAAFLSLSEKRIGELLNKLEKRGFISREFNQLGKRNILPRIRDGDISASRNQEGIPENSVGGYRNLASPPTEISVHNKEYNKELNKKNNNSSFKNFSNSNFSNNSNKEKVASKRKSYANNKTNEDKTENKSSEFDDMDYTRKL